MKFVAITGSIGCGKTTIAHLINNMGYVVFDVDGWVRRLYFQKDFIKKVSEMFPQSIVDGHFNKRALRNLVFSDRKKLKQLEELIHPFLRNTLKRVIRRNAFSDDLYFIDCALLFEMGWDRYCDFIIVADVDYETQKQRVMDRDKISAEDFDKINNVQMSNKEKISQADLVVETDKTLNGLKAELISVVDCLEAA